MIPQATQPKGSEKTSGQSSVGLGTSTAGRTKGKKRGLQNRIAGSAMT